MVLCPGKLSWSGALSIRLIVAAPLLALAPAVALAADVGAQDADPRADELSRLERLVQRLHDFETVIAAGGKIEPSYEGSDEFKISPIPYASMTFYDRITLDVTGVSAKVVELGPFSLYGKVGYDTGRSEDESDALDGLGDVDFGVTVGGRIEAAFGVFTAFAEVDKTLGGSDGLTGTGGLEVNYALRRWLRLGAEASATVADENYMDAYFGIDASQSQRSGYERYDPDAGLKRLDLKATATVAFSENWFVRGEAGVGLLVGDAADSPIVKNELQPSVMLVLGYRF